MEASAAACGWPVSRAQAASYISSWAPSPATTRSARRCWMAWNEPMMTPNALRALT